MKFKGALFIFHLRLVLYHLLRCHLLNPCIVLIAAVLDYGKPNIVSPLQYMCMHQPNIVRKIS
ncbi:hypothetical protein LguiA_033725 [Lonicera macranthoides]